MTRVGRVTAAGPVRDLRGGAKHRFVVPHRPYPDHSPFLVLVEDWIAAGAGFDYHPHRGFETVTLVLDGVLDSGDHLGDETPLGPGDAQFMTAGRGILHGGRPSGGAVHALQLWLNLPRALKGSAPGPRGQTRAEAVVHPAAGAPAAVKGGPRAAAGLPPWSRWPMTLTDLRLAPGAEYRLPVAAAERALVYVLEGEVTAGDGDASRLAAGEVAWVAPVDDAGPADATRELAVRATVGGGARVVAYASRPIDEPVALGGGFVMNTEDEIREAFADARAGRLAALP